MDVMTAAMIIPGGALLGFIILAFLQYHLRNNSLPYINSRHVKFFTRRYLSDYLLHRYLRSMGIATPLYLLSLLSILSINTAVLIIAILKDRDMRIKQTGEAVLINLILLLVCGRPNVFSERIRISQQFKGFIHRWLGIVTVMECIVHLTAALTPIYSSTRPFRPTPGMAGLTAAISMAILGLFSLPLVRRQAYELFLSTHIALTITTIIAIFLHLAPFDFSEPSIILTIIASSLCAILMIVRLGISIWNRAEVKVFEESGLLKADITLTAPRQIHPGQYIYLRVPSTSLYSLFESHPFFIASWDHDKKNKTKNITVLIQRRKGFTRLLQAQREPARAFLEGPYGESPSAEDYGNVILFASGIGITAHLGCIKQLLNARDQGPTRTQVISLLWEVEEIEPWGAAIKMVHELLDQDAYRCDKEAPDWKNARSRYVFQYTMFIRQRELDWSEKSNESETGRQRWKFEALNAASTLKRELSNLEVQGQRSTRTLISVCANREMANMIRSTYAETLEVVGAGREGIDFYQHNFYPSSQYLDKELAAS